MDESWLIFDSHKQLFYRPDCAGYTGIRDHAGRYSEDYARNRCSDPSDGLVALPLSEAVEFTAACFEDLKLKHVTQQREALRAERDAYRATLMDIASVKHPDQQRTPHQEMARECVRKWETGK